MSYAAIQIAGSAASVFNAWRAIKAETQPVAAGKKDSTAGRPQAGVRRTPPGRGV